jgi:O6-methylguanine-DNA--protein-cysteine methyltransferase
MPTMQIAQTMYTTMKSPIGELLLVGDGDTLSGLYMQDGRKTKRIAPDWTESPAPFADVRTQLEEYFAGERTTFDVSLAPEGAPFEPATARSPAASASRRRRARWARPTGATRSR